MAGDIASREPWGTLVTNHQCRFKGYDFVGCEWSDLVTLEDIDQTDGRIILEYRTKASCPIVNDEDRYETYREPAHPRYFFRRLFWSNLLSGGHATYGSTRTFEPHNGELQGIYGYYDACRDGKLKDGAHDFNAIHQFFPDTKMTMVGMIPDDSAVGDTPNVAKCARTETTWIVYLANPSGSEPETDEAGSEPPPVALSLPAGDYTGRWYHPMRAEWTDIPGNLDTSEPLHAPDGGDWVLLIRRQ